VIKTGSSKLGSFKPFKNAKHNKHWLELVENTSKKYNEQTKVGRRTRTLKPFELV
jgi:hypothetical protein